MIIKSHIRGGYRAAADYLKDVGKNEKIRLVEISDPDATNLDEAFQNMWAVASTTKATKPLHHISINPFKSERLTDAQVLKIVKRAEEKYGYKPGEHQRVIVEHVLNGRQHFHVMWNRVSLTTGKAVWPGEHWKKSKQVCREMEKELGLKRPMSKRVKRIWAQIVSSGRSSQYFGRYQSLNLTPSPTVTLAPFPAAQTPEAQSTKAQSKTKEQSTVKTKRNPSAKPKTGRAAPPIKRRRPTPDENIPDSEKMPFRRPEWETAAHLAWAFENGRADVLAEYGIYTDLEL
jgi:hypothetical protein